MKHFYFSFILLFATCYASAQVNINSASMAIFAEGLTHPGLKLTLDTQLHQWDKTKTKRNGSEVSLKKYIGLSPTIGFYFHRRYQTGIFFIPELSYNKVKENGYAFSFGIGAGYMRTIIPNTYEVSSSGDVSKVSAGHNYFITNYFARFGKSIGNNKNLELFIKPQFMYAVPNFPNGVAYLALESGLTYNLPN